MAGTYQQVLFGTLAQELSIRLGDPPVAPGVTNFWSQLEIRSYLREAFRTWQAFSAFYASRVSTVTTGALLYDVNTLPGLAPTLTDRDLVKDIAMALQEPFTNGGSWPGTAQYDLAGVVKAIQNRRDRFRVESGLGLKFGGFPMQGGADGTFEMPDEVVDVRRVMWRTELPGGTSGVYSILWKADQYTLTAGSPDWFNNPGQPLDYSTVLQTPLAIQLSPPPSDAGTVHIIYLFSGPDLDPATSATILGIPDDLAWVVKFGALADLFSQDGEGGDPGRAAYCEERWRDGIQLARIFNQIRFGYLNGVPTLLDSIDELDQSSPNWVTSTPALPQFLSLTGNIAATNPISLAGSSLSFDVTPNFPVPASDLDYVQLGREYLDIILDYAEHLANVKVGAGEIKNSYGLYQNFASQAAVMNDRLRAQAKNFDVLSDKSRRSEHINPRRSSDVGQKELNYAS